MLLAVALLVLQLSLTLHVRSTLTAAAAEGARVAALAGSGLPAGERRARELLEGNIASEVVTGVHASRVLQDGHLVTQVQIDARLPLLGLLGPQTLQIAGHAIQEHA